ncbi:MAG TPA: Asp-tRNA(Asn)/Glu-tRNA(Gln) amidotransferase subunit GatB, partial [Microterricola sp.]
MARAQLMDFDKALELFEPVMGFEVHVELNTKTKMFSDAPNEFGAEPNTGLSPLCLGLPGTLPVVNEQAVRYSISLGLALGCSIAESSSFARKNYFYPDTPKNYQISQFDEPIAFEGSVEIELADGTLIDIPVERAHMEEDAGKLTHIGGSSGRIQGADYSLVDYNRAGVPLVEIVTKPIYGGEHRSPEIAKAYVSAIRDIVVSLGISDAKMERGNLRCDANVSLRPRVAEGVETPPLGTRTETKNVNSLRSVERAVRYEIQRQAAILAKGGSITQETRHWHEDTGETSAGRPKSDADDYRYFPEPDLLPVVPSAELIEELRAALPEQPAVRRRRLKAEWGFTELEFQDIQNSGLLTEVSETVAAGASPAAARKWWTGEIARLANAAETDAASLISAADVAALAVLVEAGTLTDRLARQVLEGVIAGEGTPQQVVDARGLAVVSDDGALIAAIDEALAAQPDVLEKIRDGKVQAAGAVIGAVMKA